MPVTSYDPSRGWDPNADPWNQDPGGTLSNRWWLYPWGQWGGMNPDPFGEEYQTQVQQGQQTNQPAPQQPAEQPTQQPNEGQTTEYPEGQGPTNPNTGQVPNYSTDVYGWTAEQMAAAAAAAAAGAGTIGGLLLNGGNGEGPVGYDQNGHPIYRTQVTGDPWELDTTGSKVEGELPKGPRPAEPPMEEAPTTLPDGTSLPPYNPQGITLDANGNPVFYGQGTYIEPIPSPIGPLVLQPPPPLPTIPSPIGPLTQPPIPPVTPPAETIPSPIGGITPAPVPELTPPPATGASSPPKLPEIPFIAPGAGGLPSATIPPAYPSLPGLPPIASLFGARPPQPMVPGMNQVLYRGR